MSLYYKNNILHFGSSPALDLSLFCQNKKTPFYLYKLENIKKRKSLLNQFLGEKTEIHYSIKANSNLHILQLMKELNCGVDVVSGGEIQLALQAGFHRHQIIYSGVGKTREELQTAISLSLKQINVESEQELIRIGEMSRSLKQKTSVAFRVNPQVNPKSHPYIVTGFRENKFGMNPHQMTELKSILNQFKDNLDLTGLTMHIGSQITQVSVFREAIQKLKPLFEDLRQDGFDLKSLNIGGGLGVFYKNQDEIKEIELMQSYGKMVQEETKDLNCKILCEPGRWLVARSGILITEIQYIKKTDFKNFIVVDTGMHHLLRPALYQSYHRILPILDSNQEKNKNENKLKEMYDVVGPICESSDFLGKDRVFSSLSQEDLLVICDVGAYGFSMANHYNSHSLPSEFISP